MGKELWFPRLIVVPLSSQEVDGVRKEKERLTTALPSPHPEVNAYSRLQGGVNLRVGGATLTISPSLETFTG
jgi:hypothetical protein